MEIINKIINICVTSKNEFILLFTYKKFIKGLKEIIDNQNKLIIELENQEIKIYNDSMNKILGKSFQLKKFNGVPEFWKGKLGVKSIRKVKTYQDNPDWIEVPVTFGSVDTTFYWYFYKLGEER